MKVPRCRHETAQAYALQHPDPIKVLNDMLAVLT
jgi:hypothetical protein